MTITKSKTHEESIDAEALELLKLYLDKDSNHYCPVKNGLKSL